MVVSDSGRTTVACCVRRDVLQVCRTLAPGQSAGNAIEAYLRRSCRGVADTLENAQRDGDWLSAGPIRPGIRVGLPGLAFRVGNAAGESHPLVGEGIGMALRSASLLANHLSQRSPGNFDAAFGERTQRAYSAAWQREFGPRLRIAAAYARMAMNPALTAPTGVVLGQYPRMLNLAARLAGKARRAVFPQILPQELA
jgi:flavin-dependent dehydrogenase